MQKLPKISIVTPSFNQGHFLEETILSIINQNYPNLEYIIIDGGSKDNSVDIIKKYEKHLSYWISENDKGQADAINKGLSLSTGDIFNWINSDDILMEGALDKIAKLYSKEIDCYCGSVLNFNENGNLHTIYNTNINYLSILNGTFSWHQPGVWFRMDVIKKVKIITDYHFAFDYKMMLDIFKQEINTVYCGDSFVKFRLHGLSKTMSQNDKFCEEYISILKDYRNGESKKEQKKIDIHIMHFLRVKYNFSIVDSVLKSDSTKTSKRVTIIKQIFLKFRYNFNRYTFSKLVYLK